MFFAPPISRRPAFRWSGWLTLGLVLIGGLAVRAAEAKAVAKPAADSKTATTNAPAQVVIPQSVFDPKVAKDPFFPWSERLKPKPSPINPTAAPVPGTSPAVQPARDILSRLLKLKGITISRNLRLALINDGFNDFTLAAGEEVVMKSPSPGGVIKVRCVEIKDKSVSVMVEGESQRKELRLPGEL